ncbi:hypothetical protein [Vibrio phage vB_VpaP_SJSY21]|nr:hypothetical protein [Vibrio phage vB_VpaP_SJSY21]
MQIQNIFSTKKAPDVSWNCGNSKLRDASKKELESYKAGRRLATNGSDRLANFAKHFGE